METRSFKMDDKLLYDVILRQAGSITKAWLEAVMNSVDAKASFISFDITEDRTIITDDGAGMTTEQVEKVFEVFGAPHTQSEDKVYGEFRMGRGQLFAFGKNTWLTKNNKMTINIKEKGLTYDLEENGDFPGCQITIDHYTPLKNLNDLVSNFNFGVKYVSIPVKVNGIISNTETEEYTYIKATDDCLIKLKAGQDTVKVYNQGVFVNNQDSQGLGGVIISKKPLKLNFARNDIQSDCPAWKSIREFYEDCRREFFLSAGYKDEDAKKAIIQMMDNDDHDKEQFSHLKVFRTANANWVSLKEIRFASSVSFARLGDRLADKIMQSDSTKIVLDETFCYYAKWLLKSEPEINSKILELASVIETLKLINTDVPIEEKNLSPIETKNLDYLRMFLEKTNLNFRSIKAGSGMSEGWTDSKSYICINRRILKLKPSRFAIYGFNVLIHELSHEESSEQTDVHGENFYKRFHDLLFKFSDLIPDIMNYEKSLLCKKMAEKKLKS